MSTPRPRLRRPQRTIELTNDTLEPRRDFARERLGVSERTVVRMYLPTIYIGGVAHVPIRASLQAIEDQVKSPRRRA
jgi:hypothetical protein